MAAHRPGEIVRSELEHRFLELVRQAGLPSPETNVKLKARGRTYEIDCLWREQRVAVELDGRAAHARITAFESDRRKDAALSAIGLRPLRFTWLRVTREPADVIAELGARSDKARRVHASYTAFRERTAPWSRISLRAVLEAREG